MGFNEEYLKLRKQRLKEEEKTDGKKNGAFTNMRVTSTSPIMNALPENVAPVANEERLKTEYRDRLHAIAQETKEKTAAETEEEEESKYGAFLGLLNAGAKIKDMFSSEAEDKGIKLGNTQTWFKGSDLFKDGFQKEDIVRLISSGGQDLLENLGAGIANMGELTLDGLAMLGNAMAQGQLNQAMNDELMYSGLKKVVTGEEDRSASAIINDYAAYGDEVTKGTTDFVKQDLYDAEKVAKFILTEHNPISYDNITGRSSEADSIFGEKTDSLAQSGGQLLGTAALQAAGVPAWLTIGTTAFGGESENALNNDATYEEAFVSGMISAGAEILTEKISGGIDFGMGTLDKGLSSVLAANISNKTLQTLAKLGVDMAGEGLEEVFSGAISALGQKLTYAKDKELNELFSSEDAFESFIGGAVLGGVSSGGSAVVNNVKGTDTVTGLKTDTEQKVVDRVYKDALAEAEADGTKLSVKDKSKLYDSVMNQYEKGYISTDIIEEVLGGDEYKAYKDAVANEEALQKEYDELYNMKNGDKSNAQIDREAELKAKLLEITSSDQILNLKNTLDSKMSDITKDTGLVESYNEKTRRGQTFEADLSQYEPKQAAIVQKAIESGILNNTNRTHEFVDMVSKISADKGVLFDFANNAKLKESGFALEGKTINGFVTKDGVTLNIDSAKSLNSVVGHEITHVLEGTELYTELSKVITEYAKSKGDYQGRYDTLSNLYKGVKDADIDAELTADLVGDYLFTDQGFINSLSVEHRNVFQKIYDEIKYLYKVATAGSKEARELEKVKKVFEQAYKQSGKTEGTKYSMSDNTGKALTKEQNEYFKDSKMRDESGNLKVMYHGSQDAGFHTFDPSMSDDGISLFFVDRNDVAASYSGTSETYEAQTIKTAEDMNKFIESIGAEGYEVAENNGKFTLYYEGDRVADSKTAKGIYEEFCWYEGVGEGDANYKVYLNLTNPLEIDAKGRPWNKIDAEFSQEIYDKYNSLTAEEKAALTDLAEWEDFRLFNSEVQEARGDAVASAYAKMGENCNIYDLFSVAADNFSEDSMRENARGYLKTRDYAQRAKEGGYDGVIIKNVHDNGGYSNGSEGASTVAIAFNSEQVKSVANEKPTADKDIRYSLSEYTAEEKKAHNKAVVDHFGKTYSWAETGYLLLDGTRLDLSGKHDGAPGGYRTVDHRDITEALGYDYGGGDYSGSLVQFMSEGNIRIIPECNGINLSVKPTEAQEQALSNFISRYRGEVMVDIDDLNGNTVVSVEYPYGTYYTKVLNDIREWFDNGKKPKGAGDYSLTKEGDTPKRYGNYNVYGKDIGLAPTQSAENVQNIAPEAVAPEVAPVVDEAVDETYPEDFAPMEHSSMYEREVRGVQAELDMLATEASRLYAEGKEAEAQAIIEQMQALADSVKDVREKFYNLKDQEKADREGYLNSLTDADAPPEMEAPYYEDGGIIDPFDDRDIKAVGNQKVKAYMYENPEVKPYFQVEAKRMLKELGDSTKGERFYTETPDGQPGVYGSDSYGIWQGVSRHTSPDIEYLLDSVNMSYADIEKGLKAIIEDNGAENIAAAKKIEFILNDRLLNGYEDLSGYDIPANQEYRDLIKEKGVTEYNEEALRRLLNDVQTEDIAPVAEQYEAIKPKPTAEPRMKRADSTNNAPDGMEERRWYETSTGSEAVDGMVTPDDIPDDVRYYQVKSNKKTLAAANARLARDGYAKSREYFESKMYDKKLTVEDIALGERLIQEAAKAGDAKAVRDLIIDVSIIGTELGQRVQALSMIRRLTPEGQLKALTRMVERGKAKGDKAFEGVEVTEEMTDNILKTYKEDGTFDQADLDRAVEDAKQKIADQMNVTAWDKVNAWRYLSMLGNPKTHIRNIVSNVAMMGTSTVKNVIARTIEDIAPIKTRTKTWKQATDDVKKFAQQTTLEMDSVIKGDTKYSEEASIKAKRQIFKTKAANWAANANNTALEWEDAIFSKTTFRRTLQEYLTANGIKTEADILNNPEIVSNARDYALEEAKKATFRQDSYLANKISEIEKKNAAFGVAVGSIMPFKKTPINIAKTGLAYSPLGFARNIYDAVQVKKGNMDASEAIDHLAQTLTGTSLTLIGYALASAGILNGAGEDDKEGKYDYQLGEQSYSFNFGGDTYSLSWLSPVAMPLFVGANAYEKLVEGEEWDANVVIDTLAQTLDPLSEMSFLSSLDDVLSSYDSGVEKFMAAGESMVQNYATQFVPTLSSQVASTFDDTKRSTAASRDSSFKFGEETVNKIMYKIPGLRNTLAPTTDIWGNEVKQNENILERGFESFFSPANKREGIATAVDNELKSLYGETDDSGVLPAIPQSYINYDGERYDMSTEEYTEYKKLYGQTAYELMEKLFNTETYQNATSEERADMVNRVYDYARDNAKKEYFDGIDLDFTNATKDKVEYYKENSIVGAIEADLPVDEYEFSVEYPEKYKFFKDNDLYDSYKAADEDGKRAYNWAYENPNGLALAKAITGDVVSYRKYASEIYDIKADKDEDGKSINGSRKEKVIDWINDLDADYGEKIILFKSEYKADDTYNYEIIDYLNSRDDISYKEMEAILKELGFTVDSKGNIYWD